MDRKHLLLQLELHAERVRDLLAQVQPRDFVLSLRITSDGKFDGDYTSNDGDVMGGQFGPDVRDVLDGIVNAWVPPQREQN